MADSQRIIALLSQYITLERWETMQRVVRKRTRQVTIVLEEIVEEQNISAAIRSAEGFGVQDVHVIARPNQHFSLYHGVAKGAAQWLTISGYSTRNGQGIEHCFAALRAQGYTMVATTPHAHGVSLSELSVTQKTALIFGTEETGVSDYVMRNADAFVTIPMYGFTESFNISVSVAVCLYAYTSRMRMRGPVVGELAAGEQSDILAAWLVHTVRGARVLCERAGLVVP